LEVADEKRPVVCGEGGAGAMVGEIGHGFIEMGWAKNRRWEIRGRGCVEPCGIWDDFGVSAVRDALESRWCVIDGGWWRCMRGQGVGFVVAGGWRSFWS